MLKVFFLRLFYILISIILHTLNFGICQLVSIKIMYKNILKGYLYTYNWFDLLKKYT
jgi:hypothetical protein